MRNGEQVRDSNFYSSCCYIVLVKGVNELLLLGQELLRDARHLQVGSAGWDAP